MKKLLFTFLFIFTTGAVYSCSDLSESVRDQALGDEVFDDQQASEQSLAPVYAGLQNLMASHNWLNNLQSMSSYEQITPFRGGTDWFDGGRFIEMHQHTWSTSHVSVIDVWGGTTQGVARAQIAEKTISDLGGDAQLIAEARAMKALYNHWLLDMWNVAFDAKAENAGTGTLSTVYRNAEAVDYLVSELEAVESQLASVTQVGETRFNQGAALALKARILLNEGVYADQMAESYIHNPATMQEVIDITTELIQSGEYQLETENYFDLFGLENEGNPELIFAFRQSDETGGYGSMAWFQTSRNRFRHPDFFANGSDGAAMTEEFFDLWEGFREDPRYFTRCIPDQGSVPDDEFCWNRGLQIGQQYGIVPEDGVYQRDSNGDLLILPIIDEARSGDPLIYTREVGLESDNGHVNGARVIKWDLDPTTPNRGSSSINMGVLRLGEVYLMRAEANARLGNWNEALNIINELRNARGARDIESNELSTLSDLEREWYFETYHEHMTRTIQIRFENWEDTWRDKNSTDEYRRLFPIPQNAIDAAEVESGYLTQNPGY